MQILRQIESTWTKRSISDVQGADILQLFEAFQRVWPTESGRIVTDVAKQKAGTEWQREWLTLDHQNGYLQYFEDSPDSELDERLTACVWRRENGHRLLAVNINRVTPRRVDVLCFYDYDAQTATLTPEKSLASIFTPSFPGFRYYVELPRKGKNMIIREHYGWLTIEHKYTWDGMKPVASTTTIEHLDYLTAQFSERYFFDSNEPLSEYALVDIDSDGMPELWLRTANEAYQALFSVWPTNSLLGGQDGRLNLSFYRGAVCSSGTCGALCMMSRYVFFEESSPQQWLIGTSEWNNEQDDYGPTSWTLQGEAIPAATAELMEKSLGQPIEPEVQWRKLPTEP